MHACTCMRLHACLYAHDLLLASAAPPIIMIELAPGTIKGSRAACVCVCGALERHCCLCASGCTSLCFCYSFTVLQLSQFYPAVTAAFQGFDGPSASSELIQLLVAAGYRLVRDIEVYHRISVALIVFNPQVVENVIACRQTAAGNASCWLCCSRAALASVSLPHPICSMLF